MTKEELIDGKLCYVNPSYEDAMIGITFDGRIIYDYDKMVASLMKEDDITEDEAIEFIDYNTIGAYVKGCPVVAQILNNFEEDPLDKPE